VKDVVLSLAVYPRGWPVLHAGTLARADPDGLHWAGQYGAACAGLITEASFDDPKVDALIAARWSRPRKPIPTRQAKEVPGSRQIRLGATARADRIAERSTRALAVAGDVERQGEGRDIVHLVATAVA
jgi:hypothetical protein